MARVLGGLLVRLVRGFGAAATDAAFFVAAFAAFVAVVFFATGLVAFAAAALLATGFAVAFVATGFVAVRFLATDRAVFGVFFVATGLAGTVFFETGFAGAVFLATGFATATFFAAAFTGLVAETFFTGRAGVALAVFFAAAFTADLRPVAGRSLIFLAAGLVALAGLAAAVFFAAGAVGLDTLRFAAGRGDVARFVALVDARRDVAELDGLRGGATWLPFKIAVIRRCFTATGYVGGSGW